MYTKNLIQEMSSSLIVSRVYIFAVGLVKQLKSQDSRFKIRGQIAKFSQLLRFTEADAFRGGES